MKKLTEKNILLFRNLRQAIVEPIHTKVEPEVKLMQQNRRPIALQ